MTTYNRTMPACGIAALVPRRLFRSAARGVACLLSVVFAGGLWASAQSASAATQLVNEGTAALQRGELGGAEGLFRRAITAAPDLADGYFGLGLVELRRGAVDDATAALTRATTLNPQLQGAHLFLGIAEYQAGQAAAAATALKAELALNADNTEALRWLGIVDLGSDRPEAAIVPFDRAVVLRPDDPELLYYRARAHALVAEQTFARLYRIDPDAAIVHRALAENLAGSGQPEKAIAEYRAALTKQPGNPDLLEALGEQQQSLSRFDEAEATYNAELVINPDSAVALYNLGKIRVERGRPKEGVVALRAAIARHARPAPADFYLGLGLAELGENAEAAHWLEQSVGSQPSPFIAQSAWYQLARVYQRLGRHADADHALAALKQLKAAVAPAPDGALSGAPVLAPSRATPEETAAPKAQP